MALDPNRLKLDQITRVLESIGWRVVATDLTGPTIRATIEIDKTDSRPA